VLLRRLRCRRLPGGRRDPAVRRSPIPCGTGAHDAGRQSRTYRAVGVRAPLADAITESDTARSQQPEPTASVRRRVSYGAGRPIGGAGPRIAASHSRLSPPVRGGRAVDRAAASTRPMCSPVRRTARPGARGPDASSRQGSRTATSSRAPGPAPRRVPPGTVPGTATSQAPPTRHAFQ